MADREAVLKAYPEKDPSMVKRHPTPLNSAIFVYKYGRLEKIEPATPENLNIYEPTLPPKFFEDEKVNTKDIMFRALPKDRFASGTSPYIQVIIKKAMDMDGVGKSASMKDFQKAIINEYEIMKDTDESRRIIRGIVNELERPGGPGYLNKYKDNYRVGNMIPLGTPFTEFRKKVNPIKDQMVKYLERMDTASYSDIKSRIMDPPLEWLTNSGYIDKCLDELEEGGYVEEIYENTYKFLRRLRPFDKE